MGTSRLIGFFTDRLIHFFLHCPFHKLFRLYIQTYACCFFFRCTSVFCSDGCGGGSCTLYIHTYHHGAICGFIDTYPCFVCDVQAERKVTNKSSILKKNVGDPQDKMRDADLGTATMTFGPMPEMQCLSCGMSKNFKTFPMRNGSRANKCHACSSIRRKRMQSSPSLGKTGSTLNHTSPSTAAPITISNLTATTSGFFLDFRLY